MLKCSSNGQKRNKNKVCHGCFADDIIRLILLISKLLIQVGQQSSTHIYLYTHAHLLKSMWYFRCCVWYRSPTWEARYETNHFGVCLAKQSNEEKVLVPGADVGGVLYALILSSIHIYMVYIYIHLFYGNLGIRWLFIENNQFEHRNCIWYTQQNILYLEYAFINSGDAGVKDWDSRWNVYFNGQSIERG